MIDINLIRKDKEKVRTELNKRKMRPGIVDDVIEVDKSRRDLLLKIEELRAKQNSFNKEISSLDGSEKQQKLLEMKAISERLKEFDPQLKELDEKFSELMYQIPNISHPSVPIGPDESGNVVEKTWGEIPQFSFTPKDHMDIALEHDLIDMEKAAEVSGSRFYYLKNDLVRMEFAIVQYLLDFLSKKGYTPLTVPMLVKKEAMYGTGFFPAEEKEVYSVNPGEDDLYLIGTSEIAIASLHQKEIIDVKDMPKKYMAFSSCFRREAGTYGKDTRGIFRVHQFDKIEMFQFVHEDQSWKAFDETVQIAEELLERFELPYQRVNMCTGDISSQTAKKYDLEVWIPSQEKYRELVSATNATNYQARRLNIRIRNSNNEKTFAHTINSTAAAMTRLIIAIMENYQKEDGTVSIPQVLRPYMGGQETIGSK